MRVTHRQETMSSKKRAWLIRDTECQRELGPCDNLSVHLLLPTQPTAQTRANGCRDNRHGHNPRIPKGLPTMTSRGGLIRMRRKPSGFPEVSTSPQRLCQVPSQFPQLLPPVPLLTVSQSPAIKHSVWLSRSRVVQCSENVSREEK